VAGYIGVAVAEGAGGTDKVGMGVAVGMLVAGGILLGVLVGVGVAARSGTRLKEAVVTPPLATTTVREALL
jgi:hypothetical protein